MTAAALLLSGVGMANADPKDPKDPYPSQAQVEAAKRAVAEKARSVAEIRASLVVAQQQADAANTAAEVASENYNGAVWALHKAERETRQARKEAGQARAKVAAQRNQIAHLATQSYQQGTDLNTMTALLDAQGPTGLMTKVGLVQSAGDSLEARYEQFQAVSALADVYAAKARKAEAHQHALAEQARAARDRAASLAISAQAKEAQVAQQRDQLIDELAKAQDISLSLARQRQDALERIAREKAAAAARARALAEQRAAAAAARQKARDAAQQAQQAQQDAQGGGAASGGSTGPTTPAPQPIGNPAPPPKKTVEAAIDFAKAQLGKPYLWGGTGPDRFDCSGLMLRAWQAAGVYLPRTSRQQYWAGTPVAVTNLKRGDLLFWSYDGTPGGIHHVALYLGKGRFIESPHTGSYVRFNSIYTWFPDFAVRL
ncbi:MAG TPA: NlpC/P60 family protein [Marmoricola sp.]|nr:NlpC/P60 family protein [Marmoricola sp.]